MAFPEALETELGGLFYLLNVGLYLGLYGDFTMPALPDDPFDPWDFVAVVGRRLLGRPLPDDLVWDLLERLADRSPGRPRPDRRRMAALTASVRELLASALGCPTEDAAAMTIVHPARVTVTPARVEVALSLAGLPIEIRMAGLDRDPGWIPAAGRAVVFRFD
jgi:hypothetical protein